MTNIVLAYCILYKFLRGINNGRSLLKEVDCELVERDIDVSHSQNREDDYRFGSHIRDTIPIEMWRDYSND